MLRKAWSRLWTEARLRQIYNGTVSTTFAFYERASITIDFITVTSSRNSCQGRGTRALNGVIAHYRSRRSPWSYTYSRAYSGYCQSSMLSADLVDSPRVQKALNHLCESNNTIYTRTYSCIYTTSILNNEEEYEIVSYIVI